jgi:twitching motility protein PilT
VIIGGKAQGMQFMDEAIWEKLRDGYVSPMEAYMKALDKSRFKAFLPPEDAELANAGGGDASK